MTMELATTTTATTSRTKSLLLTSGASGRVNALLSLRAIKCLCLLIKAFLFYFLLFPFQLFGTRSSKRSSSKDDKLVQLRRQQQQQQQQQVLVPMVLVPHKNNTTTTSTEVVVVSGELDVSSRRDIAIKRATDEDEPIRRQFFLFVTSRGDTLFTQSWTPVATTNIRGVVVLLHGLNEHSGRYSDFAKKLNAKGYKVYGMDWTGHGGSDGLHAYVHSLDYAVNDMKAFLEKVVAENTGVPCFCFGHSTGAAIILKSMIDPRIGALVKGVVLTSPAVGVQPSHYILGVLAPIFSLLLPKYQFRAANKNGTFVSRDPEALIAKYTDPLVYTGSIRIRTGCEILRISSYLQQHLSRLTTPFLVLHGTSDAVTEPRASIELHEKAASTDKFIKLYKGLLHDLLFEPEREVVANDIIEWLNSRCSNY